MDGTGGTGGAGGAHDAMPNVPEHLRGFVVEQDYTQYTAVDQAVWRFVLLQTYSRLVETAHPAYGQGLAATGISVERIPSISEMNEKLSRFGWGAACVDGFIPPRAFQEFQAHGILPIAADIRTREHLVYTPAPDIIHEAAGHAPILPDPMFSAYLRRIGDLGRKAFTFPEEDRVYRAIYVLSEVKEDPTKDAGAVGLAETELAAALASAASPSEAARLSRLYWWTAEYGLVGRPDEYKIYGAGLLSSLGESHSCHSPGIRKLPLDEHSMDVAYDITRPQPQLFVVPSFEALHDVLDRAARSMAVEIGGHLALERAVRSRDLCSVEFSSGLCVMGVLAEVGGSTKDPSWMAFEGPVAFAWDGKIGIEEGVRHANGHVVLTGSLAEGGTLEGAGRQAVDGRRDPTTGRHVFRFATGAGVEGRLERSVRHPDGRLMRLFLKDVRLALPGRDSIDLAEYVLVAAGLPVTAHAGAADPKYHSETAFSSVKIPRPRALPLRELRLQALYEQAERAHQAGRARMQAEFPRLLEVLARDHPEEWLLRWNLLESLLKTGDDGRMVETLRSDLERLELQFDHREPIASGLRYLSGRAA
jgi:phenylalanine-4-hydroxylase